MSHQKTLHRQSKKLKQNITKNDFLPFGEIAACQLTQHRTHSHPLSSNDKSLSINSEPLSPVRGSHKHAKTPASTSELWPLPGLVQHRNADCTKAEAEKISLFETERKIMIFKNENKRCTLRSHSHGGSAGFWGGGFTHQLCGSGVSCW